MDKIERRRKADLTRDRYYDGRLKILLNYLRLEIKENQNFLEITESEKRSKEDIIRTLRDAPEDPLLNEAIEVFLDELDKSRESKSAWLIDSTSGFAIVPIKKESLFQTISIKEDGTERPGSLILHPAITTKLALNNQYNENLGKALSKLTGNAVEHEKNPDSIISVARNILEKSGVEIKETDGDIEKIEIGKENPSGIFQSPNSSFHRFNLFGEILAKKLNKFNIQQVQFLGIERKSNAKSSWYEISFISRPGLNSL